MTDVTKQQYRVVLWRTLHQRIGVADRISERDRSTSTEAPHVTEASKPAPYREWKGLLATVKAKEAYPLIRHP